MTKVREKGSDPLSLTGVRGKGSDPLSPVRAGIGESVDRPDGTLKVRGEFAFSSDL